jgi:hypothetical protein
VRDRFDAAERQAEHHGQALIFPSAIRRSPKAFSGFEARQCGQISVMKTSLPSRSKTSAGRRWPRGSGDVEAPGFAGVGDLGGGHATLHAAADSVNWARTMASTTAGGTLFPHIRTWAVFVSGAPPTSGSMT